MPVVSKLTWVAHSEGSDRAPINAIDVHPDGTRFTTAGDDSRVKLWNLKPCVDVDAEADEMVPRLLATLSGHLGSVTCVRWSPDGVFLASCSEDSFVMIWRLAAVGERVWSTEFGADVAPSVESWVLCQTLRGHTGDVLGVAWAPDSRRLGSVSIDNTVRVWDVLATNATTQLLACLEGHANFVKGVSWDPIGRYIASHGDDRAVILWSARDWTQVARVEEPFHRASFKTLFRRPCWSPDGQFLCCALLRACTSGLCMPTDEISCAHPPPPPPNPHPTHPPAGTHAVKKPADIAVVLRRPAEGSTWAEECDFVGHQSPVACARFNPRSFRKRAAPGAAATEPAAGPRMSYSVVALGGQDCNVSVWVTAAPKPLLVVRTLFDKDVLDVSWTPDGYTLLMCSMDGSVALVQLTTTELGVPITDEEHAASLRSLYGDAQTDVSLVRVLTKS